MVPITLEEIAKKAKSKNIKIIPTGLVGGCKNSNGDKFDISNSIVFDGNSSFDPDDKDILKYSWISNTSGNLGFGSSIEMMLTDIGWHKITLTVTDQYGLSSSAHVDIYVFKELISLINMKPELTNCTITPKSGDTDSEFTFSVKYYDKDSDLPTFIKVIIDGQEFNLTLKPGENGSNGIYEYKTKLSEDNHSYYFMVNDGFTDIFSGNATTPRIIKPQSKSAENMDKSAKWVLTLIIILIVIIIIISIILIFSLIIRPKISKRHLNHKYNPIS